MRTFQMLLKFILIQLYLRILKFLLVRFKVDFSQKVHIFSQLTFKNLWFSLLLFRGATKSLRQSVK